MAETPKYHQLLLSEHHDLASYPLTHLLPRPAPTPRLDPDKVKLHNAVPRKVHRLPCPWARHTAGIPQERIPAETVWLIRCRRRDLSAAVCVVATSTRSTAVGATRSSPWLSATVGRLQTPRLDFSSADKVDKIVGKAIRVGPKVTLIKDGQRVGVGAQSYSCLDCRQYKNDNETYCQKQLDTHGCIQGV